MSDDDGEMRARILTGISKNERNLIAEDLDSPFCGLRQHRRSDRN